MNNKFIFLPISFLILLSIVLLALEVPSFGLLVGFKSLLLLSFAIAFVMSIMIYRRYNKDLDGQYRIALAGNSLLWSLVITFAFISIINRKYATNSCEISSYKVVAYQGRYTAGYGNIEKGKVKANQWIIKVLIEDEIEQFILEKDISYGKDVTRDTDLEFCKGIWGTKYLRIN